jgi:hypothetical protein
MANEPTRPGFYWAKWKDEQDAAWEIVEVSGDMDVCVLGIEKLQEIEDFIWSKEQPNALKEPRS